MKRRWGREEGRWKIENWVQVLDTDFGNWEKLSSVP